MNIKELCKYAHENAKSHGFWEDVEIIDTFNDKYSMNNAISTRLMLIVAEVSEALEGLRKNDAENFREELADVAIRLFDLCGGLDIDLETEIITKMAINKTRSYKHGKQF
jgi:NTP pyrophosphatase (non-canonical NTP hydrolase)